MTVAIRPSDTYACGLDPISNRAFGGARCYYAQDGLGPTVALSNNGGTGVGTASYVGSNALLNDCDPNNGTSDLTDEHKE